MAISSYFANLIYGWMRGQAMPTPPTVYVALFNGDPQGSSATEQSVAVRAAGRVAAAFGAPAGGFISNPAKVDFGLAASNASLTHAALMDAASGGNILDSQPLPNPRTVYANDPVYFDIGQLQFQLL